MPLEDNDDKVGYKRPPKATRFKKGQSGNPNGRRKQVRPPPENMSTTLKNVLEQEVAVRNKDGKKMRMTALEVLLQKLMQKAIEGDTRALHSLTKMAQSAGLFETLPETKKRYGGVLVVNGTKSLEEWRKMAEEQQRPFREHTYVKGPTTDPDVK